MLYADFFVRLPELMLSNSTSFRFPRPNTTRRGRGAAHAGDVGGSGGENREPSGDRVSAELVVEAEGCRVSGQVSDGRI